MPKPASPSLLLDGTPAPATRLPDLSRIMGRNSSFLSSTDKKLLSTLRPVMSFLGSSRSVEFSRRKLSSMSSITRKESGYFSQNIPGSEASSCNSTALNAPKLSYSRAIRERTEKEAEEQQSSYLEQYLQEFCQQLRSDLRLGLPHERTSSIQENKIKHYQSHVKETIEKKLTTYKVYFYALSEIKVISELFSLLSTLQMLEKLSQDPSLPKFSCGLSFSNSKNSDKRVIKIIAEDLKKIEKLAKKNANKLFKDFHPFPTPPPRIEDIVELILPKKCYTNTFNLLSAWLTEFSLSLKKGDFTNSKIFYRTLKNVKRVREADLEVNKSPSESNGSTDGHVGYPLGRCSFFKSPVCPITKSSAANEINTVHPTLKRSASI